RYIIVGDAGRAYLPPYRRHHGVASAGRYEEGLPWAVQIMVIVRLVAVLVRSRIQFVATHVMLDVWLGRLAEESQCARAFIQTADRPLLGSGFCKRTNLNVTFVCDLRISLRV